MEDLCVPNKAKETDDAPAKKSRAEGANSTQNIALREKKSVCAPANIGPSRAEAGRSKRSAGLFLSIFDINSGTVVAIVVFRDSDSDVDKFTSVNLSDIDLIEVGLWQLARLISLPMHSFSS